MLMAPMAAPSLRASPGETGGSGKSRRQGSPWGHAHDIAPNPIDRDIEYAWRARRRQTTSKQSRQAFSQDPGANGWGLQVVAAGVGIDHCEDRTGRVETSVQRNGKSATERLKVALVIRPIKFVLNDQQFGLNAERARSVQCVGYAAPERKVARDIVSARDAEGPCHLQRKTRVAKPVVELRIHQHGNRSGLDGRHCGAERGP